MRNFNHTFGFKNIINKYRWNRVAFYINMIHGTFYSSVLCSASSGSSFFSSSGSRDSSAGFYKIHTFETIEKSYPHQNLVNLQYINPPVSYTVYTHRSLLIVLQLCNCLDRIKLHRYTCAVRNGRLPDRWTLSIIEI